MKVNTATKQREMSGVSLNVDYGIQMGAKAYHVLQDGMYSDIVSTIVRELSSNAYDAHVAAGKADEPFHVFCPSAFDADFAVKDNGTGLRYLQYEGHIVNERDGESTLFIKGDVRKEIECITKVILNDDDVIQIAPNGILFDHETQETVIRIPGNFADDNIKVEFDDCIVLWTTYFASTKDDSDEFIGGWGLGSKTPNAYVDNYMVVNRFNGVKRTYNVSVSEIGMPQISLMVHETTKESNGLEVRLPVDPDDYDEFRNAIKSQLRYFQPHPIVHNEEIEFPEVVHVGDYFMLMRDNDREYGYRTAPICVGNNAYVTDVSSNLLRQDENVVMRFKVGEVKVTTSREELKYDDQVRETIRKREDQAISEYRQYLLDSIDMSDWSDYEKAIFLNENNRALDLSETRIRNAVGNPHYYYDSNQISIRLGGWGNYTNLNYVDQEDDQGNKISVVHQYTSHTVQALRWHEYKEGMRKSTSIRPPLIEPGQKYVVFIRDNRYSYLKKVSYWLNEIDDSGDYYHKLFLVDAGDDDDFSTLDMVKPQLHGNVKFVRLTEVELPKTVSTASYSYSKTPVARILDFDRMSMNYFQYPKHWEDDYTPLTHLEQENVYIVEHHRGESQMSYNDVSFFVHYLEADLPFDHDITIYALPQAKYEKAIEYGFTPISELIEDMRENVEVPRGYVNYRAVNEKFHSNFRHDGLLNVFNDKTIKQLPKDNPVRTAYRLREINKWMIQRWHNAHNATACLVDLEKAELPEVSPIVKKVVEMSDGVCDNINQSATLLSDISYWNLQRKTKEVVDYLNWIFNTGEDNE